MSVVLNCANLSHQIPGRVLFEKLSFSQNRGEFLAVLGRNGAGKTTLLRKLTGDLKISEGSVEIFDKKLEDYGTGELAQKRAVLSQSTPLNFDFKVIEVVLMGRIPHQSNSSGIEEDLEIAMAALQRVGLCGFENRNYLQLSGGEQQRVHLARVLVQLETPSKDHLLFLDEPTSSLDISHQHRTLSMAKEFCKQGGSVLAILHDLNLAARYADKILLLVGKGEYLFGSSEEILTSEVLSRAFDYEINVVKHPHRSGILILS